MTRPGALLSCMTGSGSGFTLSFAEELHCGYEALSRNLRFRGRSHAKGTGALLRGARLLSRAILAFDLRAKSEIWAGHKKTSVLKTQDRSYTSAMPPGISPSIYVQLSIRAPFVTGGDPVSFYLARATCIAMLCCGGRFVCPHKSIRSGSSCRNPTICDSLRGQCPRYYS